MILIIEDLFDPSLYLGLMVLVMSTRLILRLAIILVLCVLAGRAFAYPIINEVMWPGSDISSADEWIELTASEEVDLSQWTLAYLKSSGEEGVIIAFDTGTTINAEQYFLISNYGAGESRLAIEPDIVTSSVSLPNNKLFLRLYNAENTLVDEADDGSGAPLAGSNSDPKASMERTTDGWQTAFTSVNFDEGSEILGTPGAANSIIEDPDPPPSGTGSNTGTVIDPPEDPPSVAEEPEPVIPNVRITEVLANPIGRDDEEWIELANLGTGTVSLTGWTLESYTLSGALQPGEYRSLRKTETSIGLSNHGETIELMSGDLLIDEFTYPETAEEVSYGEEPYCIPTEGAPNEHLSLDPVIEIQSGYTSGEERVSINLQASVSRGSLASATCDWDYGDGFTSGSCNPPSHTIDEVGHFTVVLSVTDYCGDTIERTLSVEVSAEPESPTQVSTTTSSNSEPEGCTPSQSRDVRINEFLPNPEGDDAAGEWIELVNTSSHSISLCGWSLDDEEGGSKPYSLGSGEINANGFLVIERTDSKLALNNSDDRVRLLVGSLVLDEVSYGKSTEGQSFARKPGGGFEWTSEVTKGRENRFPKPTKEAKEAKESKESSFAKATEDKAKETKVVRKIYREEVLISEVYPSPTEDEQEWIEIHNFTGRAADLSGWKFDDIRDGGSRPWTVPSNTVVPARGYLVLSREQTGVAFNNGGDEVWLVSPDEKIMIGIAYPKIAKGQAYLPSENCVSDQPTPGVTNVCPAYAPAGASAGREIEEEEVAAKKASSKPNNKEATSKTKYKNAPREKEVEKDEIPERYKRLQGQMIKPGKEEKYEEKRPKKRGYVEFSIVLSTLLGGGGLALSKMA